MRVLENTILKMCVKTQEKIVNEKDNDIKSFLLGKVEAYKEVVGIIDKDINSLKSKEDKLLQAFLDGKAKIETRPYNQSKEVVTR